ncbi:M20 aminoacylase family protein [Tropicimonas sp. S265A]|uniref:M20 aminoacylase family protein n=1 Tax=Tropicimonas sp. S265A TaxID=3415134 RepID=UPI003C7E959E
MAVVNRIAEFAEDMSTWRRALHRAPELGFDCAETAAFVVSRLQDFGVDEIHEGFAKTGVVALINGQAEGGVIGLRADMDALPIEEQTDAEHASLHPGRMHACGHDGHTTMLLGAARYLAETRKFAGKVALIFQPAEEDGGGAGVMVEEGMLDQFDIAQVYALHNAPNIPEGMFITQPGPVMAAVDNFHIYIRGEGGHAAMPHETSDPIIAALGIGQAIQTIVSRNHSATDELVISVTQVHAGTADNIVPDGAYLCGTVRSFDPHVQEMVARRLSEIVKGQAASFGVRADLDYQRGYPPTVNSKAETEAAVQTAAEIVGDTMVDGAIGRQMGAEDFAYMLQARPGAYVFLGQGAGATLHHPAYDFNDRIAPIGASYFARLVERLHPLT